jgi:uncharacterized membrane protein YbhN (UPF0104 family)
VAAASSLLFVAFLVASGAILSLVLRPWLGIPSVVFWPATCIAAGAAVLWLWPTLLNDALRRMPARLGLSEVPAIHRRAVAFQLVASSGVWMLQGVAFFCFSSSYCTLSWSDCPRLAGAYVLSPITGLLAVFAPGGIGVREGMLGYLLGAAEVGGVPVHVAALGGRVLFTSYEVATILAVVLYRRRQRA